jgi:peptidoglycan/xylan/chitin deacetylase (PgdA/CDA1 family)
MDRIKGVENRNTSSRTRTKIFLIAAIYLLLSLVISASLLLMPVTRHTNIALRRKEYALPHPTPTQPSATQQAQNAADALARSYLKALLQGQYSSMWLQLHPDIQAIWQSEPNFNNYWKARFQDYTLQAFTLGVPSPRSDWIDPETMIRYTQVEELSSSLQLSHKGNSANQPPENTDPGALLQNLPFIVQKSATSGQWFVLCGGPADLEAPMTLPQTLVEHTVQVPILMYHHISDVPTQNILDYSLTITPTNFGAQLDYLKTRGYHSITLNQLAAAIYYGLPLPAKPIIFSFDDGYSDGYKFAYPLLQAHNYSGIFYIITGKVGWDGQMSWSQMRTMLAHGMQIGSHTIHHVNMGAVYQYSQMQAQQELQISQDTLQKNLHIAIQHFCYPNGDPFKTGSLLLRNEVAALVAQTGYITATTDPGMTGINQSTETALSLLRIRVDGRETQAEFQGSMPW